MKSIKARENLLDEWYKVQRLHSSKYLLYRKYSRDLIDSIRSELLGAFGAEYFEYQWGQDKAVSDISYVLILLMNKHSPACVIALAELNEHLLFAKKNLPGKYEEVRNNKNNSRGLQGVLYEIFIIHILMGKGISVSGKASVGDKPLDGAIKLLGKVFVAECKKVYMPGAGILDWKMRLFDQIQLHMIGLQVGVGFNMYMKIADNFDGNMYTEMSKRIEGIFSKYNQREGKISDQQINGNFGDIVVRSHASESTDIVQGLNEPDILVQVSGLGVHQYPNVDVAVNFSVPKKKIEDKLQEVLKKAFRQHRDYGAPTIVFIDSQTLPSHQLGILHVDAVVNAIDFPAILGKRIKENIVIITRRIYGEKLEFEFRIVYPDNGPYAEHARTLFQQLHSTR